MSKTYNLTIIIKDEKEKGKAATKVKASPKAAKEPKVATKKPKVATKKPATKPKAKSKGKLP